jgi:hypothetical protein
MYMIHAASGAFNRPTANLPVPFAFDRDCLREPVIQRYLEEVALKKYALSCACRSKARLPLTAIQRDRYYYVARPGTALDTSSQVHAPNCYHAQADVGKSLGFKNGVLTRIGSGLVLNWDLLLEDDGEFTSGGGGGGKSGQPADHGPRLRSLLWLLLGGAGMNAYHPGLRTRQFFSSLYAEAKRIAIGRGGRVTTNFADRLLCTDWFDKSHKQRNESKLKVTPPAKSKWVMALCLLPDCTDTANSDKSVDLFRQLGVSVRLPVDVLEAGFDACPEARSWHQSRQKVLMLGLVKARARSKAPQGGHIGFVRHLALLPIHERYVPVPSAKHAAMLDRAIAQCEAFVVEAEDDQNLRRA